MAKKKTPGKPGAEKKMSASAKKKRAPKKAAGKKAAPKPTSTKAPKAKAKSKTLNSLLEHWRQRPGTFTYELDNENGAHLVCHARHAMTDEDLFTQYILHSTFDMAEPMKAGETKVFNAVDDPIQTFKAMFKNPPPGWMQYARRAVLLNRIRQRESQQKKLKQELGAKGKPAGKGRAKFYRKICLNCHGRRWVCEDHPTLPWEMRMEAVALVVLPEWLARIVIQHRTERWGRLILFCVLF
jgi:hypothetical protein